MQVAQRQQQQRLLQQQLTGIIQPASPAATPALVQTKTPVNSKQKTTLSQTSGKKILRVNGAKVIMSNNVDKVTKHFYSFYGDLLIKYFISNISCFERSKLVVFQQTDIHNFSLEDLLDNKVKILKYKQLIKMCFC